MAPYKTKDMETYLGDGLGAFRDRVLGELSWEDEAHRGLDLARRDRRLLRVRRELCTRK